jgi:hypothetical protein
MKFIIELDRTRNDGLSDRDRDAVIETIQDALLDHYEGSIKVVDAYLDHWERLGAGEATAESGSDEWSQTMSWALGRCEPIFDNWHSVPPIFPTVRIV